MERASRASRDRGSFATRRGLTGGRGRAGPGAAPLADGGPGPRRAGIDSRLATPGELFVGLRGERADGGAHAPQAMAAGAWGALVAPEHAAELARSPGAGALL